MSVREILDKFREHYFKDKQHVLNVYRESRNGQLLTMIGLQDISMVNTNLLEDFIRLILHNPLEEDLTMILNEIIRTIETRWYILFLDPNLGPLICKLIENSIKHQVLTQSQLVKLKNTVYNSIGVIQSNINTIDDYKTYLQFLLECNKVDWIRMQPSTFTVNLCIDFANLIYKCNNILSITNEIDIKDISLLVVDFLHTNMINNFIECVLVQFSSKKGMVLNKTKPLLQPDLNYYLEFFQKSLSIGINDKLQYALLTLFRFIDPNNMSTIIRGILFIQKGIIITPPPLTCQKLIEYFPYSVIYPSIEVFEYIYNIFGVEAVLSCTEFREKFIFRTFRLNNILNIDKVFSYQLQPSHNCNIQLPNYVLKTIIDMVLESPLPFLKEKTSLSTLPWRISMMLVSKQFFLVMRQLLDHKAYLTIEPRQMISYHPEYCLYTRVPRYVGSDFIKYLGSVDSTSFIHIYHLTVTPIGIPELLQSGFKYTSLRSTIVWTSNQQHLVDTIYAFLISCKDTIEYITIETFNYNQKMENILFLFTTIINKRNEIFKNLQEVKLVRNYCQLQNSLDIDKYLTDNAITKITTEQVGKNSIAYTFNR
ncbi:hypothetical protein DLAC_03074 [Tieghemostelium lacteum]|uniref:Uncharacterized protein n=1 Tax=Tieghemostelium lacteum TaxID=361077 RepID=A0A152A251_TIELA|nr:hypothetical protein DLAC_03074 [Tieghemostelium lacteum]|eukprot:KYR00332.1 hypothetical protein DLAC_03074 [Tieghemostelium lacteum]